MHGNIEAFWHPASELLAIGISAPDGEVGLDGRMSEYAVFTAVAEGAEQFLASVVEPRRHAFWTVLRLPRNHRYIHVRSLSEGDRIDDVAFLLVQDADILDGDYRIAAALTGTHADVVHVRKFSDILPEEQIVQILSPLFGDALVSIASHRQSRADGEHRTILVGPAKLIWPLDSRVQVEALPVEDDHSAPRRPPGQAAIQQFVATEDPPRARLRLYLNAGSDQSDLSLNRFTLVHVMHQRRFFELLYERRQQSRSRAAQVEALPLKTIRTWFKDEIDFDAVEADKSILVVNLASEIAAAGRGDKADIEVTVGKDTPYVDVEFLCAALGDDIGIASSLATEGDFSVRPTDPGGDPRIRLFRLRIDRLEPLMVEGRDEMFRKIMAFATMEETRLGAKPAQPSADGRRWAAFLQRLGLPPAIERLRLSSNPIGALLLAAWSEIIQGRRIDAVTVTSEFQQFRRAPALVAALARFPRLSSGMNSPDSAAGSGEISLPRQIAATLGAPDLVPASIPATGWGNIWRALAEPDLAPRLITARISLDGESYDLRTMGEVVQELYDEQRVNMALECGVDRAAQGLRAAQESTDALREYLDRRRKKTWTPLSSVLRLRDIVREFVEDLSYAEGPEAAAPSETPDERDFATTLAAVENLIAQAAKTLPSDGTVRSISNLFEARKRNSRLDRRSLRQMEQKLIGLLGVPGSDKLANELTETLERWAGLPDFTESMKPRLRLLGDGARRKRDVVTAIVNRVRLSRPEDSRHDFDLQRSELSRRIRQRLVDGRQAGQDLKDLANDLAAYGDILVHHRAWLALQDLTRKFGSLGHSPLELQRFNQRFTTWPLRAAEIWDEAKHLAAALADAEREQFARALTPPDLGETAAPQ
jgi:hypothetical protein